MAFCASGLNYDAAPERIRFRVGEARVRTQGTRVSLCATREALRGEPSPALSTHTPNATGLRTHLSRFRGTPGAPQFSPPHSSQRHQQQVSNPRLCRLGTNLAKVSPKLDEAVPSKRRGGGLGVPERPPSERVGQARRRSKAPLPPPLEHTARFSLHTRGETGAGLSLRPRPGRAPRRSAASTPRPPPNPWGPRPQLPRRVPSPRKGQGHCAPAVGRAARARQGKGARGSPPARAEPSQPGLPAASARSNQDSPTFVRPSGGL